MEDDVATVFDYEILSWRHPNRIDWNCMAAKRVKAFDIRRIPPTDDRWFKLFKHRTPEEACEFLQRVKSMKEAQWRWLSPNGCAKANRRRRFRNRNNGTRWARVTRHHLKPGSRKGRTDFKNMLIINEDRHQAWHDWVGTATLDEVIAFMERWVNDMKLPEAA